MCRASPQASGLWVTSMRCPPWKQGRGSSLSSSPGASQLPGPCPPHPAPGLMGEVAEGSVAPEPNLRVTFPAGGKSGGGVVPVSLIVPWAWATVGTRACRAGSGGSTGWRWGWESPGQQNWLVTGGPAPRPRTGHYVLIISSFLTPK